MIDTNAGRKKKVHAEAFCKERYRPGVISPARVLWGSAGAGIILALTAVVATAADMMILYPPLAATCFITASCAYLRVARPKPVIIGHCVSALAGLFGIWAGNLLPVAEPWGTCLKLGIALGASSVLMQVFDADHPPAAATAVFPILSPEVASACFLPLHMAWGATLAACLSMAWNRIRFEFPAREEDCAVKYAGVYLPKAQFWSLFCCAGGAMLMLFKGFSKDVYAAGTFSLAAGVLLLGTDHLWAGLLKRMRRRSMLP